MSGRAIELLRRRIGELDEGQLPIVSFDADRRLLHFIEVISVYTNTSMAMDLEGQAVLVPADADADDVTSNCRLLVDIAQDEADLVDGPLRRTRQQWIGTGRHTPSPTETPTPAGTGALAGAVAGGGGRRMIEGCVVVSVPRSGPRSLPGSGSRWR
jgi:hypothetical protein